MTNCLVHRAQTLQPSAVGPSEFPATMVSSALFSYQSGLKTTASATGLALSKIWRGVVSPRLAVVVLSANAALQFTPMHTSCMMR
jgi:hypothetical protein